MQPSLWLSKLGGDKLTYVELQKIVATTRKPRATPKLYLHIKWIFELRCWHLYKKRLSWSFTYKMRLCTFRELSLWIFLLNIQKSELCKEKSALPGPTLTLFAKLVSIVSKATAIFNFDTTRIKIKRISSILPLL